MLRYRGTRSTIDGTKSVAMTSAVRILVPGGLRIDRA